MFLFSVAPVRAYFLCCSRLELAAAVATDSISLDDM